MFYRCDGLYQVLPSDFVCLTVPKKFVGTLQCFRNFLVSKNFYGFFVSHYRKLGFETLRCFRNLPAAKKTGWMEETGGYHVSLLKIFRLTVPKVLNGNSSLFQKKSYSENFIWMLGVISSI